MMKSKKTNSFYSNCPCVGATLDKLVQPAVLALLMEGPSYGYELARRIAEIPNFIEEAPDVSGVYRLLKALEARGMVVSELGLTEAGRAKRLFSITEEGQHCLKHWNQTLFKYHQAVHSLLLTTQKAMQLSPHATYTVAR